MGRDDVVQALVGVIPARPRWRPCLPLVHWISRDHLCPHYVDVDVDMRLFIIIIITSTVYYDHWIIALF